MELRIIKNEEQHRRCLEEARRLARADPAPQSGDGARLELLAKLIDDYERERFRFHKPDPIEAILFRMEEQGLRQEDIAFSGPLWGDFIPLSSALLKFCHCSHFLLRLFSWPEEIC